MLCFQPTGAEACPHPVEGGSSTLPQRHMTNRQTIRVVAAEISDGAGHFLIAQRLPHASMPLLWEFPGGKVEPGESDAAALAREIEEELGVQIVVGPQTAATVCEYERCVLDFHCFAATVATGQLQRIGVHDFRWVGPEEFADYPFPPADQGSIERLLAWRRPSSSGG